VKVALVHDWLTGMRGGERCLEAFLCVYPNADVFTLIHVPGATSPQIDSRVKAVSFLNRIPGIRRVYKACLPLYPLAIRSLDLSGYDLIISLSHAAAKNVRVPSGARHVCYCFTPMRYIWDQARSYMPRAMYVAALPLISLLRMWDVAGARSVESFVAISSFVSARVRRYYRRTSIVIPPPVRMEREMVEVLTREEQAIFDAHKEPFFLCAGALVPYKKIDVAVEAFTKLGMNLWVVGGGPEQDALKAQAGDSVKFFGRVSEAFLWECYRRCRALVFPGIEDFGIVPVEVLAAGKPVIGVDAGGLRESIVGFRPWRDSAIVPEKHHGVFIRKDRCGDAQAMQEAIKIFCSVEGAFRPDVLRARANEFSYRSFFAAWSSFARSIGIGCGDESEEMVGRDNDTAAQG
jgi:glycosyltransferase involved in cell wall biosynthesis